MYAWWQAYINRGTRHRKAPRRIGKTLCATPTSGKTQRLRDKHRMRPVLHHTDAQPSAHSTPPGGAAGHNTPTQQNLCCRPTDRTYTRSLATPNAQAALPNNDSTTPIDSSQASAAHTRAAPRPSKLTPQKNGLPGLRTGIHA